MSCAVNASSRGSWMGNGKIRRQLTATAPMGLLSGQPLGQGHDTGELDGSEQISAGYGGSQREILGILPTTAQDPEALPCLRCFIASRVRQQPCPPLRPWDYKFVASKFDQGQDRQRAALAHCVWCKLTHPRPPCPPSPSLGASRLSVQGCLTVGSGLSLLMHWLRSAREPCCGRLWAQKRSTVRRDNRGSASRCGPG